MKQFAKQLLILISFLAILILPYWVFAGTNILDNLNNVADKGGYQTGKGVDENSLIEFIGNIVSIFLGFLGIIFVCLMIYAGFLWMTARGNEDKVTKSKEIIKAAIIGLVLIVSSWSIWYFILTYIINQSTGGSTAV